MKLFFIFLSIFLFFRYFIPFLVRSWVSYLLNKNKRNTTSHTNTDGKQTVYGDIKINYPDDKKKDKKKDFDKGREEYIDFEEL